MSIKLLSLFALLIMLASCQLAKSPIEIANQTTRSINTIGSITYRQSLLRGITSGFEEPIPSKGHIRFNPILNYTLFNTSDEVIKGYKISEQKP